MHLLQFMLGAHGDVRSGDRDGLRSPRISCGTIRKAFRNQIEKLRVGQVSGSGDHHIVRGVALLKPGAQRGARKCSHSFGSAKNGLAERVGIPEILSKELMHQVFGIVLSHANFFEDDRFLPLDLVLGKFWLKDHVRNDVERFCKMLIEHFGVEADHFLGGEGIQHAADAIHFARDVFGRAAVGTLEHHVFDEVGNAIEFSRFAARA